jgi:hypothetical protein
MIDEDAETGAAGVVRGARDLSEAGRRLAEQRHGPGAWVEAASGARPWGHDDIGRTFDRHYRPVERQVLDAWEQLAAYVESLGEAAERSVGGAFADRERP